MRQITHAIFSRMKKSALRTMLLLLFVFPVWSAQGQSDISVQTLCVQDWIEGLPPQFEGTIYRVQTPQLGYSSWQLERITSEGTELTYIAVPHELYGNIWPSEVSPDGDYIVFQPLNDETPLAVWEIATNQFATLNLPLEDAAYLSYDYDMTAWQNRYKLSWISPNQFIMRYLNPDNIFFLDLQAEQVFTVSEKHPLAIVASPREITTYPAIPFPEGAELNTRAFSPQRSYTTLLYDDNIPGLIGPTLAFQIYSTETEALVAEYHSSESHDLVSQPLWSPDEQTMFVKYNINGRLMMNQVNVGQEFVETHTLEDSLAATFGANVSFDTLHPEINDHKLVFTLKSADVVRYAAVYDYDINHIIAVCRDPEFSPVPIDNSSAYIVWGPDERFISYYDGGTFYLFDTVSGQRYWTHGAWPVGWINTPTTDGGNEPAF